MKQILLAIALIAAPAAAFTAFELYASNVPAQAANLGDLSSFKAIVADVQGLAAKGDLAGAAKRITDYETAWDQAETAIRPLDQNGWNTIDAASDAALKALRQPDLSADAVNGTLTALMAALDHPDKPAS
ncbi:UNVERIFIED_ORG: histidine kinase [Roseateles sp. XES5]|nr:histidine kinase [Roseateles sp. XES5]